MKASIAVISIGAMTSASIIIRIITTAVPIMATWSRVVFTIWVGRVALDSATALAAGTADRRLRPAMGRNRLASIDIVPKTATTAKRAKKTNKAGSALIPLPGGRRTRRTWGHRARIVIAALDRCRHSLGMELHPL
jgi:hypothetical protein